MRNLNYAILIGRLGKDPELKETKNKIKVTDFSICNNRDYRDKDGNDVQRPNWVQCRAYAGLAETICKYLHKGSKISVSGEITVDSWEGEDGKMNSRTYILVTEMEMLDKKEDSGEKSSAPVQQSFVSYSDLDDEDVF